MTEPRPMDGGEVTRYSAEAQLRRPRQFFRSTVRGLLASRHVALRLFRRDISARYRQSLLGYVWIFAPPLVTAGVWLLLSAANIVNTGDTEVPYPVFVLVGTLLWQGFVEALNSPLQKLAMAQLLLTTMTFPAESLLLAAMLDVLLNACVRLVLLVPLFFWFGIAPTWSLALVPVGLLVLTMLGFAIGLIIAPLGTLYHDVRNGLLVATSFWFLITPVAYLAPEEGPGSRLLKTLNPAAPPLSMTRSWLTGTSVESPSAFLVVGVLSILLMCFGWVFYRLSVPHLVDRIAT